MVATSPLFCCGTPKLALKIGYNAHVLTIFDGKIDPNVYTFSLQNLHAFHRVFHDHITFLFFNLAGAYLPLVSYASGRKETSGSLARRWKLRPQKVFIKFHTVNFVKELQSKNGLTILKNYKKEKRFSPFVQRLRRRWPRREKEETQDHERSFSSHSSSSSKIWEGFWILRTCLHCYSILE